MSAALKRIWLCWAALLLLLATTTGAAFLPLGRFNPFVALAIAGAKALIVLIVFMELRRSSGLVRAFAAAGFFWLAILLTLTSADYLTRRDTSASWQPEPGAQPGETR
ncbi:MAG TPA: cytochrome C oxidase subunit IV family protein [Allosphingosinicella sp.]|nr:cytochrome C oxidase subunit IV family protein [Allosphingosinicella sp.]